MRYLITILLCSAPLWADISPTQSKSCPGTTIGPSHSCTFDSAVTAGALIVGFVRVTGCTGTADPFPMAWSDNKSNTWQEDGGSLLSALQSRGVDMGSAVASTGGASFTVTATVPSSQNCTYWVFIISEYPGMASSSWRDGSAVTATSGSGTATSGGCGTITTTNAADLVVTGVGIAATADQSDFTVNSSFVTSAAQKDLLGSAFHAGAMGQKALSSTGSETPVWSWTSNVGWSAVCTAYKQATVAAGADVQRTGVGRTHRR